MKKLWVPVVLLVFCVPLFIINVHNVHDWGDDSYQYLQESLNLLAGKPYHQSTYIFDFQNKQYAPPQYPPGFPILIMPVIKLFGTATRPLLIYISMFLAASLFILYRYYKKQNNPITSVCLALIVVYSSTVIYWKQDILSDIPGLFMICLYFLLRNQEKLTRGRQLALIGIGAFAILTRSQIILLPLAELTLWGFAVLRQTISGRRLSFKGIAPDGLVIGAGTLVVMAVLNFLVFPAPSSTQGFYFSQYSFFSLKTWQLVGFNANYIISIFQLLFSHEPNDAFLKAPVTLWIFGSILFALMGFYLTARVKWTVEHLFLLFTIVLLLFTPFYQGDRYLIPVLPLFVLFVKQGAGYVLPNLLNIKGTTIAIVFTALFLALGYDDYERFSRPINMDATPYKKEDQAAFKYIRKNVGEKEVILFSKPRALAYFTGKQAMAMRGDISYWDNEKRLDSLKITYLLWSPGVSEYHYMDYLRNTGCYVDSTIINKRYTLYKLR